MARIDQLEKALADAHRDAKKKHVEGFEDETKSLLEL